MVHIHKGFLFSFLKRNFVIYDNTDGIEKYYAKYNEADTKTYPHVCEERVEGCLPDAERREVGVVMVNGTKPPLDEKGRLLPSLLKCIVSAQSH